jgi:N-acetylmuramoyl-L-alanine amidase-like protein
MALTRKWMPSPNYSSRGGSSVRLIVIHSTEGATTIEALGNWFANPSAQVSSHTGIDDVNNNVVGEYVKPPNKAWTAGNANPYAIQTELCCPSGASANWSRQTWLNHENMLRKCADWVREESQRYGIPLTALTPSQAQGSGHGVCEHKDLGAMGGGHYDCGNGFPMDEIIRMAKGGQQPQPEPAKEIEDEEMFYLKFNSPANPDSSPAAAIAIGNQYADGKCRLRLHSMDVSAVRIDPDNGPSASVQIEPDHVAGTDIPKDCRFIIVRRDSGTDPIAATISHAP